MPAYYKIGIVPASIRRGGNGAVVAARRRVPSHQRGKKSCGDAGSDNLKELKPIDVTKLHAGYGENP